MQKTNEENKHTHTHTHSLTYTLSLVTDEEPKIREQSIGFLRNLAYNHEKLLESLSETSFQKITNQCFLLEQSNEIMKHYIYVLCNVVHRTPDFRLSVVNNEPLILKIRSLLVNKKTLYFSVCFYFYFILFRFFICFSHFI
jgi:hypothetical protein